MPVIQYLVRLEDDACCSAHVNDVSCVSRNVILRGTRNIW